MKTVAIASLKGGVGKTTTAANLGAALAQEEDGVLLVDCDPRNQLGIHFGLGCDALGLAHASLRGASWVRAARDVSNGLACLPFGTLARDELRDFEALLVRRPELLREGLADPMLGRASLAVIDTAPWPSELLEKVLPLVDLVVVVLLADAASFATLPSLPALVRQHPRAAAHVLLNCVDGTRLGRDVRTVLSAEGQVPVLPFVVHRDQAVPEALASERPVLESAPSSQAAEDFRRAAEWVLDTLEAQRNQSGEKPVHADRVEPPEPPVAEPPLVTEARQ